jgi:hypothetical protein
MMHTVEQVMAGLRESNRVLVAFSASKILSYHGDLFSYCQIMLLLILNKSAGFKQHATTRQ